MTKNYFTKKEIIYLMTFDFSVMVKETNGEDIWIQESNIIYTDLNCMSGKYVREDDFKYLVDRGLLKELDTITTNRNRNLSTFTKTEKFRKVLIK